jgi:Leucine-rich repeat (LRR) protein
LTKLNSLDMNGNMIEVFPDCIKGFSSLKRLNLKYNKIRRIEKETLKQLTNLTFLDLSQNKMEVIEEENFNGLSIMELILYDNELKEIPSCICLLPKLIILDSPLNKIKCLPNNIGNLSNTLTKVK